MSELHHKTVFVLDHTKSMGEPSGVSLELYTGQPERTTVMKSVWSYVVENVLEYSRIVRDIYSSEDRCLLYLLANSQDVEVLNSWDSQQQNQDFVAEAFAMASKINKQNDGSIENGIKAAIEHLSKPTQAQRDCMNKNKYDVFGKGRVICVTSCIEDVDLEEYFLQALEQQNKISYISDDLIPLHECELIIFSLHPAGTEHMARVVTLPKREISYMLKSEIYVVTPNKFGEKLLQLCVQNHGLTISTVTNIPMKEDQFATTSSSYAVRLYHPKIPNAECESLLLKFATPPVNQRGFGPLSHCQSAFRVTPVELINRPANCLTNHVVSGRRVWLEALSRSQPESNQLKTNQYNHVLTAHAGGMWLHILDTTKSVLDDPLSITEGVGGHVTDFRITDFREFMRLNMLIPYPDSVGPVKAQHENIASSSRLSINDGGKEIKNPIEMAKQRLEKKTTYWPLTTSSNLLFSMSVYLENLFKLMPKDTLTEREKLECNKTIWGLMAIEARGDSIPPNPHKKGLNKDEQWKVIYDELENFLRANQYSENHSKVLECFLESRSDGQDEKKEDKKDSKGVDDLINELSRITNSLIRPIDDDSPMSPAPEPKKFCPDSGPVLSFSTATDDPSKAVSLYDYWISRNEKKDPRLKFLGTTLYPNLETAQDDKES